MNWRDLTDEINRLRQQPEPDEETIRRLLERRRQWARTCGQSEKPKNKNDQADNES
jgi:hypothetical protein